MAYLAVKTTPSERADERAAGTQFTCLSSTKVQILTQELQLKEAKAPHQACHTSGPSPLPLEGSDSREKKEVLREGSDSRGKKVALPTAS
jgi:hypothetical protein